MSASFWISLSVCVIAFFYLVFCEHGETYREFKSSTGRAKRTAGFKLFCLWAVAIGSLAATIVSGVEARSSDTKISQGIASVDPRNHPIRSIFAHARITVRGQVYERKVIGGGVTPDTDEMGMRGRLWLGRLSQTKSNLYMVSLIVSRVSRAANDQETDFFLEFRMSSITPLWNAKSTTVGQIDELDVMHFDPTFLPDGVEILRGAATVTFNAVYQKEYPIAHQKYSRYEIPFIESIIPKPTK